MQYSARYFLVAPGDIILYIIGRLFTLTASFFHNTLEKLPEAPAGGEQFFIVLKEKLLHIKFNFLSLPNFAIEYFSLFETEGGFCCLSVSKPVNSQCIWLKAVKVFLQQFKGCIYSQTTRRNTQETNSSNTRRKSWHEE